MAHKSLGIIQIELPDIVLSADFGNLDLTEITTLLDEQTKKNIKQALKGEKLIYVSFNEIDAGDESLLFVKLCPSLVCNGMIVLSTMVNANDFAVTGLSIKYDSETDKYYILS